jgi:hypothetical protein
LTACPCGPWIVTSDEILTRVCSNRHANQWPHDAGINTDQLIFRSTSSYRMSPAWRHCFCDLI